MRKIINSTFISVDGVIENPDWPSDGSDPRAFDMHIELLAGCDAVLMGRRTYESFASAWPNRSGDEYSDRINGMAKYVVSSTLKDPTWNNTTVIAGDPVPEIRRLKDQPGKNIVQYGFGQLSYALMENDLLDELHLWVHPLFVGHGGPHDLMYRDTRLTQLRPTGVTTLKDGVTVLSYEFKHGS
jgi:dihydrofolate reductase